MSAPSSNSNAFPGHTRGPSTKTSFYCARCCFQGQIAGGKTFIGQAKGHFIGACKGTFDIRRCSHGSSKSLEHQNFSHRSTAKDSCRCVDLFQMSLFVSVACGLFKPLLDLIDRFYNFSNIAHFIAWPMLVLVSYMHDMRAKNSYLPSSL